MIKNRVNHISPLFFCLF